MAGAAPVLWLAVAGLAFTVAAMGTGLVRRVAPVDVPNARSSHTLPTPSGGGLAIVAALALAGGGLCALGLLERRIFLALIPGALVLASVSWWNDHVPKRGAALPRTAGTDNLSTPVRLGFQVAAASWSLVCLGGLPTLNLGTVSWPLGGLGPIIAVVTTVWLINLYNFMDGTDGLAGGEALAVGCFGATVFALAGQWGLALFCVAVVAASVGFLLWNWPPAKIFMGDVGSCVLGYLFAVLALAGDVQASVPAVLWSVPLALFLWDATFTLARRMVAGEPWTRPHRSHAYQRGSRLFLGPAWLQRRLKEKAGHLIVAAGALLLNGFFCGLGLYAATHPVWVLPAVGTAFLVMLGLWSAVHWIDARRQGDPLSPSSVPGEEL